MGDVIALFDLRRACHVDLKGVDSTTQEETGRAPGVALKYKCEGHGTVTVILDKAEDVADVAVWLATYGALLWGGQFMDAFDRAKGTAEDFTKFMASVTDS